MAVRQVGEEVLNIPAPRRDWARCHEAVRFLRAAAKPYRPGDASNGGGGDLRADRLDISIFGEPEMKGELGEKR